MKSTILFAMLVAVSGCVGMNSENSFSLDDVEITWLGHASFRVTDGNSTVYIDPYVLDDGAQQADFILITHSHFDHCDPKKVTEIQNNDTRIIAPLDCVKKLTGKTNSIKPGESFNYSELGVGVRAVEAYNVNKFREPDKPFHPKGLGVGFVLEMGGKKIYHAGDTDVIDEMKNLEGIDVALLPSGGTYTMTMSEAAEAAQIIKPAFAIPMHYNSGKYGVDGIEADPAEFAKALAGKGIMMKVLEPLV